MSKKRKSSYPPKYKTFNGKRYERARMLPETKREAQASVKIFHEAGMRARTVKVKNGFTCYWKGSKKYSQSGRKKRR